MKESTSVQQFRRNEETETTDPISMLKQDHSKVKDLFDKFEDTDDRRTQMQLAKTALEELKIHAAIEEEIFYPAAGKMVDDQEIMHEATEEHHVAHILIDELESGDLDSETFHAKFMVLAENVRHHIKEEEGQMFPKLDSDEGGMEGLGARMAQRKEELMDNPDALSKPRGRTTARTKGRSTGASKRSSVGTRSRSAGSTTKSSRSNRSKRRRTTSR